MGFVAEELNETERLNIQRNKVGNMAVVYGKEASMWKVSVAQNSWREREKKTSQSLTMFFGIVRVAYELNFVEEEAVERSSCSVKHYCRNPSTRKKRNR